jgi:FkbM family methyltransferase
MLDVKLKFRNLLFRIINQIENNNNANIHSNGEYRLLKKLMVNDQNGRFVLFDIGANVGHFSLTAIDAFNSLARDHTNELSIYAFEPLAPTFLQLQENLKTHNNCRTVNSGISENAGTTEIFFDDNLSTYASLYNRPEMTASVKVKISLERLDSFISSNQIPQINFLKIDTEGHELSVLKSAGHYLDPAFIKAIQFEYGGTYLDSRIYLRDIYNILLPKGYDIYKILRNNIVKRNYHPVMENFQYANYLALPAILSLSK